MPLYFFDTDGPGGECPGDEGTVLADLDAVQRYARRALCEIAGDCHEGGHVVFTVRVRDLTGAAVYRTSLTLSDAYRMQPPSTQAGWPCPAPDA